MGSTEIVIISIILLHFIVGIGYLMYKLSGKRETETDVDNDQK